MGTGNQDADKVRIRKAIAKDRANVLVALKQAALILKKAGRSDESTPNSQSVAKLIEELGLAPTGVTSEELAEFLIEEIEKDNLEEEANLSELLEGELDLSSLLKGLPENLLAMEKALGDAIMSGESDWTLEDITSFLLKNEFVHSENEAETIASMIVVRQITGESSIDPLAPTKAAYKALYEKVKDRPSIKKVLALAGYCQELNVVVSRFEGIEREIAKGSDYQTIFTTIVYEDCASSNLAFLIHAEEKFGVEITSAEQLRELTGIPKKLAEDVKASFIVALELRYYLAIQKALKSGAKYPALLEIKPSAFGLSDSWVGIFDRKMSQDTIIQQAIYHNFSMGDPLFRVPLREISEQLNAPMSEIVEASQFHLEG